MAKKRISSDIEFEFYEKVKAVADLRKISISKLIAEALQVLIGNKALHKEIAKQRFENQKLQNKLDASQSGKERLLEQRKSAEQELKQVASKLGVPDTATHCRQRIDEIETQRQVSDDTVGVLTEERDVLKAQRESELRQIVDTLGLEHKVYDKQLGQYLDQICAKIKALEKERDTFKAKSEEHVAAVEHAETVIQAFESQGFWERVFGRKPVV